MSARDFDAFALPGAVPTEELVLLGFDDRDVRVRHVDAGPEWITALASSLRSAGDELAARSAGDIARALGAVGARFLDSADPVRAEALSLLPATSGLSPEMSTAVLDGMAADWTEDRLLGLLRAELGDERVLDGFGPTTRPPPTGDGPRSRTMAVGPRLCIQFVAGSVPGVGVTALIRSLLLKGPTLLKPGRGDVVLPVLFARALREADPGLADALAVLYWPGGDDELDAAALASADVVTAYGSDETVAELRARTPVTARFVPYHHRVSVGVVGKEALRPGATSEGTAADVASAVAFFDQRGCVSPQVVFVEGGREAGEAFARALAEQLARLEERLPTGRLDSEGASTLHQLRGTAEMLAASARGTVIHGGASPWSVVLESGDIELGTWPGRATRVRTVSELAEIPDVLATLGAHLQTVGVAGVGERLDELAAALGRIGASRVVPFGSVAFPPPWWHHDGRGPLQDLVRWVDLEEG